MTPPRVDFLITNDGHHSAMFLPVIRELRRRGEFDFRVLSLCEFRGLESPDERYAAEGIPLVRAMRRNLRPSPATGRQRAGRLARALRGLARWLGWRLVLRPAVRRFYTPATDLAVLPNDGGFPFAQICRHLRRRGIAFLLVQEGIRFAQPHETDQGRGGADAVAVWGETSAEYYRRQGTPPGRLVIAGNPRFDRLLKTDWKPPARALARELRLGRDTLLLLTNPIEDLGFGTTSDKLELVRSFVASLEPLAADPEFRLVLKLHRRESGSQYRQALAGIPFAERILILEDAELWPLLGAARAAVVLASSAGLEALLLGLPLGVLKIPGFGYAHDYVARGAALGIDPGCGAAKGVRELLSATAGRREAAGRYLDATLAARGSSSRAVADLLQRTLAPADTAAHPRLPSRRMTDLWCDLHPGAVRAGSAFGIPLLREGRSLVNVGRRDFLGFFVDPRSAREPLPRDRRADLLVLYDQPLDGELCRRLAEEPGALIEPLYDCPVIDTGGDAAGYLEERLSKRARQRLERSRRRLEALGRLELAWAGRGELDDHFERFFLLLTESSIARREHNRNLWRRDYLAALWRELAGEELLVSVLSLDGTPISFRTGFRDGRRFVGYMPVADAAFARYSVGKLHLAMLLGELGQLGLHEYDFSKGSSRSKEAWASSAYSLAVAALPLRGGASPRLRLARLRTAVRLRRWAHSSGLAGRARRLRFRLARFSDRRFAARARALAGGRRAGRPVARSAAGPVLTFGPFRYAEIRDRPLALRTALLDHLWLATGRGARPRLARDATHGYLGLDDDATVLRWDLG